MTRKRNNGFPRQPDLPVRYATECPSCWRTRRGGWITAALDALQGCFDRLNDYGVVGRDIGSEPRRHFAIPADQEFFEVPGDLGCRIGREAEPGKLFTHRRAAIGLGRRSRANQLGVERMLVLSCHANLRPEERR